MTTESAAIRYALPAEAQDRLADGAEGGLAPVLTLPGAAVPFTILDCFHQSLRGAGRVLIATGEELELLLPDGSSLTHPAGAPGFVTDLEDGPFRQALDPVSPLRRLLPVGEGTLRRGAIALVDDEGKTRARAVLHLFAGHGGDMLVATPQGLRGYDGALDRLHRRIRDCGGAELSPGGLFDRLAPGLAPYTAKPALAIAPDEPAFDAARRIVLGHIPVMRANTPGIIADLDTEFLHDYRVALRKIRSVLSLFKGVFDPEQTLRLKARFSALMAPTGRLRDLDVYLLERPHLREMVPQDMAGGLDAMFDHLTAERAREHARLAARLRHERHGRELDALERIFSGDRALRRGADADVRVHDLACRLIWKRYRRIRRLADAIGPDTPDAEIHVLRIHCKKLRYLMEFFGPTFPERRFAPLLKPLKRLQDNLGIFNDCSVQQASLRAFAAGSRTERGHGDVETAQSIGALIAVLHRRQEDERARITASLAAFCGPQVHDAFRALFHRDEDRP